MTTSNTTSNTIRIQGVGEMPACPVHALQRGDRVMWTGGAVDVVERIKYTPSGKSANLTLRREGTGEESVRRMRSTTLVALANIDEIRTRSESIPVADEKPSEGTPGTEAPTAPSRAVETAPVASKKAPRRRSRDVAAAVASPDGGEVTVTARQLQFLRVMADEASLGSPDSGWWIDCVIDAGGYNGMSAGAMVSTLRGKGLIRVDVDRRDNPATGRASKVKAISLTDMGRALWAELGL